MSELIVLPEISDKETLPEINTTENLLRVSTTPPEQAVKNLERAKLFDVPPETYAELSSDLDPEAEVYENVPSKPEPEVDRFIAGSEQKASAIKPDIDKLNYIEKYAKFTSKEIERGRIVRERNDLYRKMFTDSELANDPNWKEKIELLNFEEQDLGIEELGIDGIAESSPALIASGLVDYARGIWKNKELIAAGTATGAGIGAALGSVAPGAGTLVGAKIGGAKGFGAALLGVGFVDSYEEMLPSTYHELSNATNAEGEPLNIDHDTKVNVAAGVAVVGGIAGGATGWMLGRKNPFIKNALKKAVGVDNLVKLFENPAKRAQLEVLGYISKSAMTGGGAGAVSELARIIGEEYGKTDKSDSAFQNVLSGLFSKEGLERLTKAGVIGAGVAGSIATVSGVPAYKSIKKGHEQNLARVKHAVGDDGTIVIREDGTWTIERKAKPSDEPMMSRIGDDSDGGVPPSSEIIPPSGEPDIKTRMSKVPQPDLDAQSSKVLNTQDAINNIVAISKETNLSKLSPTEMSNFKKFVFSAAGMKEIYLNVDDMRTLAKTPEEGEALRNMLDPSGVLASQMDASIYIPVDKFLPVLETLPQASDIMRLQPDEPSPLEARQYFERKVKAKDTRNELLESLGVDGEVITPEQSEIIQRALQTEQEASPVNNKVDYLDLPTFTENIESILPVKEVQEFNSAMLGARLELAEALNQDVENQYRRMTDDVYKSVNRMQIEQEIASLDAELKIVNRFTTKDVKHLRKNQTEIGKHSSYAIDPRYLPDDLREAYTSDPVLQKRKAFAVGGLSPDEAATYMGVDTGENLLRILANTPDKKDIIKNRQQKQIALRNEIEQAYKPDKEIARDKAFQNVSKAHHKEMKYMREKEWTNLKGGIKRIALPLPKIEDVEMQAREAVSKMPIGRLNEKQFLMGEKRSQKKAVDHFMKGEIEQAYKAKENALLNNEIAREISRVKLQVTKDEVFFKKIQSEKSTAVLKQAGKKYINARDEVLDVFNLSTSKKGLSEQGSFDKWAAEQVALGNDDFRIPKRFDEIRESASEMSPDQYHAIANALRAVEHTAKFKNKLFDTQKKRNELRTLEKLGEEATRLAEQHPDYSELRADDVRFKSLPFLEKVDSIIRSGVSLFQNMELAARYLDVEQYNGFFSRELVQPLKGDRGYEGERSGWLGEKQDQHDLLIQVEKVVKDYGGQQYDSLSIVNLDVTEFADYPQLGNGKLSKNDLMTLQAALGQADGLERIRNFKSKGGETLTPEKVTAILNKYLTKEDAILTQNQVNLFKAYENRIQKLETETTGREVKMVKGISYELHGMRFEGGYFPFTYQRTSADVKIKKQLESMKKHGIKLDEGSYYGKLAASMQTEQGHTEDRTGSTRALNTNFRGTLFTALDEVIHDLNYRKPIIDTLKKLESPQMIKAIKSIGGDQVYNLLRESTIEQSGQYKALSNAYFSDQQKIVNDIVRMAKGNFAVTMLAGSWTSIVVQPVSIANTALMMGKNGPLYLAKAAHFLAANMENFAEIKEMMGELTPTVKYASEGVDDSLVRSVFDKLMKNEKPFSKFKNANDLTRFVSTLQRESTAFLMSGMQETDVLVKVLASTAAYMQFVEGGADNFPMSKLNTMSKKEIHEEAARYLRQLTRTTLTMSGQDDKAPFQKLPGVEHFNMFWNDLRPQLNTQLAQGRKIKWQGKKTYEEFKEGEYKEAFKQAGLTAGQVMKMVLYSATIQAYLDALYNQENPITSLRDVEDSDDLMDWGGNSLKYMATSPFKTTIDSIPLANTIQFARNQQNQRSDYRAASIPLTRQLSDIATMAGVSDILGLMSEDEKMSPVRLKATLFSMGYLLGGLPINGAYKIKKLIESEAVDDGIDILDYEVKRLNDNIKLFTDRFGDDPEAQSMLESLQEVQSTLIPNYDVKPKEFLPEDTKDTLKTALSNNKWDTYDTETGAVGVYQFTEERWNEVMNTAPNLNLTENGRVAKDGKEQEKAMDWVIEDTSKDLAVFDIPVNKQTLLGAHKFGFNNFTAIYEAKDSEKLSKVLGEAAKNPVFKDFTTVGDIKNYLTRVTKEVK